MLIFWNILGFGLRLRVKAKPTRGERLRSSSPLAKMMWPESGVRRRSQIMESGWIAYRHSENYEDKNIDIIVNGRTSKNWDRIFFNQ